MNYVDVDYSTLKNRDMLADVEKISLEVLKKLGKDSCHMSIIFTSDEDMQKYNKAYRGIDSTTDVLSFAFCEETFASHIESDITELGEIYISLLEVFDNAKKFGVSKNQELARVTIHGTLHLLGYDHSSNDAEKEEMLILQEKILKEMDGLWQEI